MDISLRFIGKTIVELTCSNSGSIITTDIADSNGNVSSELIEELRDIIYELESHNEEINANLL